MKSVDVYKKVEDWYYKGLSNKLSSETSREIDPIFNNEEAPMQIHTFGDSWTYGEGVEQTNTFSHQLGNLIKVGDEKENISVHNHGARGVGIDYIVKKVSEVYQKYDFSKSIYVITMPHMGRRLWFDDEGKPKTKKAWENEHKQGWLQYISGEAAGNEYNRYFYFFHQYMLLNRLIGRDKIVWGTWGKHFSAMSDIPDSLVNIKFDCIDYAEDGGHPGVESHKLYANEILNFLKPRIEWIKE